MCREVTKEVSCADTVALAKTAKRGHEQAATGGRTFHVPRKVEN